MSTHSSNTPQYSVAIRTLGLAPDILRRELESIFRQSLLPEKVIVYIAHGYQRPEFTIGNEQYVYVNKGMVAQRAISYDEIDSEYILLLDDDVELAPYSAEKLLRAMTDGDYDCMAADTFQNHKMSISSKIYNIFTNLALPSFSQKKAFSVRRSAAFSYINNPRKDVYPSDSAAGPASMWRKSTLLAIRIDHELWLDGLGFSYGDDLVEFNKLPKNGYKLGVHFDSGIINLDAKTSSNTFRNDPKKFLKRSRGQYLIWYRCCYNLPCSSRFEKLLTASAFIGKIIWMTPAHIAVALLKREPKIIYYYFKGFVDGYRMTKQDPIRSLSPYQLDL
jgi:glycosyltransferase involved in cell wall biosynthesis